jgi:hypothetical protein
VLKDDEQGEACRMYGRDGRYRSSTFAGRLEAISHLVK